jgi:hypothetical protein
MVPMTMVGVGRSASFRSAIQAANADADAANTINLAVAGTYQLSAGALAVTVSTNLTIQNTSGGQVAVDGGGLDRVFDINPGGQTSTAFTVTFQGFTIQDGIARPGGSDVQSNTSPLTIGDTIVFGNTANFGAPDAFASTVTDDGGNLLGTTAGTQGFGAGTLLGVDPNWRRVSQG